MVQRCGTACAVHGGAFIAEDKKSKSGLVIKNINPHARAVFRYLRFGGENLIKLRLKGEGDCRVDIYLNGLYYDCLSVSLDQDFQTFEKNVLPTIGRYELELRFYGLFENAVLDEILFV